MAPAPLAPTAPPAARPRVDAGVLVWLAAAAIAAIAIALRLYRLDGFVTFYPDSYGQLRAAQHLASLEFPISYYYPPGVALFLAPFFAVLPDTLLTMQIAIVTAGIALVAVAFAWCRDATGDRRAALLFALAVAIGATFVFHSRVALFEVVNTLLIAASLWLAPKATRSGAAARAGYGVLVFAMATARYTNVIVLPALVLASLSGSDVALSWRPVAGVLRSRAATTVALVVAALAAIYLATSSESLTRFANPAYGSVVDAPGAPARLLDYLRASLNGYSAALSFQDAVAGGLLLAFAGAGAHRLRRSDRWLLLAIGYLAIVWCPVHALYAVFFERYTMVVFFLLLLLASVGLSRALDGYARLATPWQRLPAAALLSMALTLIAGAQVAEDLAVFARVPGSPAARSEASYDVIRDALRASGEPDAVLISSHVLAVDRAGPKIEPFDLVRHAGARGIDDASVADLVSYVEARLAEGRPVLYHYTPYDAARSRLHRYDRGIDAFFYGLAAEFHLTELARTPDARHRLYRIEPR